MEQFNDLQRVDENITWFERKSSVNLRTFRVLKLVQFALAALVIFCAAYSGKLWYGLSGLFGILIVVLEALEILNGFERNGIKFETTFQALRHEKGLYLANAGLCYGLASECTVCRSESRL
jgi:hypothetical protein